MKYQITNLQVPDLDSKNLKDGVCTIVYVTGNDLVVKGRLYSQHQIWFGGPTAYNLFKICFQKPGNTA